MGGVYEFPEERSYDAKDMGFSKYAAPSLKHTRRLALTFDDGPSAVETPRLLDILAKYGVKATFFMLGSKITAKTLPIVERMLREGHLVAAHSWDHENSNAQSESEFRLSLKRTLLVLQSVMASAGVLQNEVYFRFPFGAYGFRHGYHHMNAIRELSNELYGGNCINFVFWNIDTTDWLPGMTPAEILHNVEVNVDGGAGVTHKVIRDASGKIRYTKLSYRISDPDEGGVVLMHDIHTRSVDAVELILQYAEKNHVEIVPLNTVKEYEFGNKICGLKTKTKSFELVQ